MRIRAGRRRDHQGGDHPSSEELPVSSQQPGRRPGGAPAELATRLEPFVAEAVGTLGFDLESLDVQFAGRRRLVKIVVDAEDGVELDLLAEVSRVVGAALDAREELLNGPYTLEVTSPGVDRPLTLPRHWRRARLRLVKVREQDGAEFTGRVGDADDSGVVLLVGGELRRVEYRRVAKAAVEIEFKQPPAAELQQLGQEHNAGTGEPAAKEEPR
jgi:ribosome maturation factor RimP